MQPRFDSRSWQLRFLLHLAALAVFLAPLAAGLPARADCPDTTFICALGDRFKFGSSWNWSHFQCETNGLVKDAAMQNCRNPNCIDVRGRADGCSVPVPGLKELWNEIFHGACDLHDICYATIGTTQAQCDNQFLFNMKSVCGMPGLGSALYSSCLVSAAAMFDGVAIDGKSSFDRGQVWAKNNCHDPNGPTLPPPPLDRSVRIRSKLAPNKVLTVFRALTDNGDRTYLWDYFGVPDEEWVIRHEVKDLYSLKVIHSQKCLDVAAGNQAEGGLTQQWDCVGNDNQKWAVELQSDDGWVIRSKVSGKCLQVEGAQTANSTPVDQATCTGGDNQRWYFEDVVLPPTGVDVRIRGKVSGKAISIDAAGTANGAVTRLGEASNVPDQKWRIEDVGKGYYRLKVQHTQKCLDLARGGTDYGTPVQQWDCTDGNENQKWRIEKVGDVWRLRSKASNLCLGVAKGGTENGAQVLQWGCLWTDDQFWYLEVL